jgi:acylphosphatase
MKAERLQARVRGNVQGVNFRHYTRQEASALGLTGYAVNRADGSVEVVAEGPRPALEQLLSYLHHGPPLAQVDAVEVDWQPASGEHDSFRTGWR